MKLKYTLALILCAFFSAVSIRAQSVGNWAGSYEYTASLGRTTGGTGIVINYTITIREDGSATIAATGYQTDDEIVCETRPQGKRIGLYFKSYPNGGDVNAFGTRLYKKGDFLLSLERINGKRFRARWGKYNTEVKRSVIFTRAGSASSKTVKAAERQF